MGPDSALVQTSSFSTFEYDQRSLRESHVSLNLSLRSDIAYRAYVTTSVTMLEECGKA